MDTKRFEKLKSAALNRHFGLGVLLENVFDPHNIAAVLRTCDAVGVQDVYVVETKLPKTKKWGFHSSRSATKWVRVNYFQSLNECLEIVKSRYERLAVAAIGNGSENLYQTKLKTPLCIAFGNEQHGCSSDLIASADFQFHIPQVGLLQSLNISVCCGVVLYEWFRQYNGGLASDATALSEQQHQLLNEWTDPLRNKQFKDSL